jgi:folate-binding protein YgfZ
VTSDYAVVADPSPRLQPRAELAAYDGPVAGVQAFEALRVAARVPRLGLDTDHRTLPHEVGWLATAVHLDKGCYRGQETVARVHNLGRPPRRLVLLHLDGSDSELPAPGDQVQLDGRDVGRLGTAVRHHELGPIALALVKRNVPDDAALVAGGVAAQIDPAPDQDLPVSAARAAAAARERLLRLR